jgi:hypothetical protein
MERGTTNPNAQQPFGAFAGTAMTINDVHITNWKEPGDSWWDSVQQRPTEPLIEATIKMKLSWNEYRELLAKDTGLIIQAPGQ